MSTEYVNLIVYIVLPAVIAAWPIVATLERGMRALDAAATRLTGAPYWRYETNRQAAGIAVTLAYPLVAAGILAAFSAALVAYVTIAVHILGAA